MTQDSKPQGPRGGAEAASPKRIRVAMVDDAVMMMQVIGGLLEDEESIEVVGTAATGEEGLALVRQVRPDVLLLDLDLPDIDGIEVATRVRRELPAVRIVILTGYDVPWAWERLHGIPVDGCVLKHSSIELLIATIKDATSNRSLPSSPP